MKDFFVAIILGYNSNNFQIGKSDFLLKQEKLAVIEEREKMILHGHIISVPIRLKQFKKTVLSLVFFFYNL